MKTYSFARLLAAGFLTLPAHGAPPVAAPVAHAASITPATAAPAAAPAGDILDIRPPIHLPAPFPWLPWTAGTAGAVALGYGAWAWSRRPRRKRPWELALEKLEGTRPLMAEENAQPFSLAVSEIVRRFIEGSFPVRAAHRTTEEFLRDLVSLPESPLAAHREALREFLQHCDLAKFARWSLTREQMEAMLASARAFVIAIGQPTAAARKAVPAPVPSTPAVSTPALTA